MKRINWVDTAKGIGIILVVLGHTEMGEEYNKYFYSFHMPLFFLLSGLFFYGEKYKNTWQFLKKKSLALLVPYFCFSIATYAFWLLIGRNYGNDAAASVSVFKPFVGIFYSVGINNWMTHDTPLWFLTCLFVVELLFYFIRNLKKLNILIALVIYSIGGFIVWNILGVRMPWSIDVALYAVLFFGIGYLVRERLFNLLEKKPNVLYVILPLAVLVISVNLNGYVDMNGGQYGNYIYYYLGAFAGIFFSLVLARYLNRFNVLNFFGKNSLTIMALHGVALTFFKAILVFCFHFNLEQAEGSPLWCLIYTVASLILLTPVIMFINEFLPFILGKPMKGQVILNPEVEVKK